jgi:hypothetical protein
MIAGISYETLDRILTNFLRFEGTALFLPTLSKPLDGRRREVYSYSKRTNRKKSRNSEEGFP